MKGTLRGKLLNVKNVREGKEGERRKERQRLETINYAGAIWHKHILFLLMGREVRED